MRSDLQEIVEGYRKDGYPLSDGEAEEIERFCYRKMEVTKVEDKEGYLPLLFKDEVKNYFIRMAVNATALLRMMGTEVKNDVHGMRTDPLPSQVP